MNTLNSKKLSQKEVKNLLIILLEYQKKFADRISQSCDSPAQSEDCKEDQFKEKIIDFISAKLVEFAQDQSIAPIRYEDIETMLLSEQNNLEIIHLISKEDLTNLIKAIIGDPSNAYEILWKQINILLEVAQENGVLPQQILESQNLLDTLARKLFTKKEFKKLITNNLKKIRAFLDQIIGIAIKDQFASFTPEEKKEIQQRFNKEVIEPNMDKLQECMESECNRLYPKTTQ